VGTRRRGFLGLHLVAWTLSSAHGRLQLAAGCYPSAALHWTPGRHTRAQIPPASSSVSRRLVAFLHDLYIKLCIFCVLTHEQDGGGPDGSAAELVREAAGSL
jgi:hypothetical protein